MNDSILLFPRRTSTFSFGLLIVALAIGQIHCNPRDSDPSISLSVGTSLRVFELIINEIIGENGHVTALVRDNQSPHAFHPRPSDVVKMNRSSTIVLGAPELDGWVSELIDQDPIYLAEHLDAGDWIYESGVRNPHFWTDPLIVKKLALPLAKEFCQIERRQCDEFEQNAEHFIKELEALDEKLHGIMAQFIGARVYTTQPFFDYFLRQYGLESVGSLESIPGNEPPPSRIIRMLKNEKLSPSAGIIAQARLPDVAARLFQSESDLPIIFLDPIGDSNVDSYVELLSRQANQLRTMLLDPK